MSWQDRGSPEPAVTSSRHDAQGLTETMLDAMELGVAMGYLAVIEGCLRQFDPWIRREKDPRALARVRRAREFLDAGRIVEAEHGDGAMLDLRHPEVVLRLEQDLITPLRAENARRRAGA